MDLWFSAAGLGKDAPDLGVLKLIGRLKAGTTLEQAQAEVNTVAPSLSTIRPGAEVLGARLEPFIDQIYGQVRPAMHLLMAAVLSLLLIACANIANLLLARGVDRERELAVRAALGADRARLARMLFGESVVLGLVGGALGVFIAIWAVSAVRRLIPGDVPGIERLAIDWRTLAFATGLSLVAAMVFGTVPALRGAKVEVGDAVRDTTGRASSGRRVGRMRGLLVSGQLALSLGLVAAAALTAQSFRSLAQLAPGFDARGVVTAKIQLSDGLTDHRAPRGVLPPAAGARAGFARSRARRARAPSSARRSGRLGLSLYAGRRRRRSAGEESERELRVDQPGLLRDRRDPARRRPHLHGSRWPGWRARGHRVAVDGAACMAGRERDRQTLQTGSA